MKSRLTDTEVIIIIILTSLLFFSYPVDGMPERAEACEYCHTKFTVDVYENERDECGNCHIVKTNPSQHNNKLCTICHGVKDQIGYHTTHVNVSCKTCHGINGESKPSQTINECTSCHTPQIHDIHTQCTDCHESSIKSRTSPTTESLRPRTDYSKYTLYSILKTLYEIINKSIVL